MEKSRSEKGKEIRVGNEEKGRKEKDEKGNGREKTKDPPLSYEGEKEGGKRISN